MLTRIISGAVLIAVVGSVLVLGSFYPAVLITFLAVLTFIACYEILNNTGIVKVKAVALGAGVFGAINVFALYGYTEKLHQILFVLYVVAFALTKHEKMGISAIGAAIGFPVAISFAFTSLAGVYLREGGVFYLLLLLNFSSICDTGAYFTGVLLGKHKLCPSISPKKTVEGAIGGIVWSIVCSLILCFAFSKTAVLIYVIIATIPFCIIGMCGDLFASVIKRSVNLKDYGNLIPGHGGILDRFDSILLIAPVLNLCIVGGLF